MRLIAAADERAADNSHFRRLLRLDYHRNSKQDHCNQD
jgi:hypothetical protein